MACILIAPDKDSKGVVTFTTQERDNIIFRDDVIRRSVQNLKSRWVIGLHHNWHDYNLRYDPLFDFHMAGEEDLKEADGKQIPLVPLDACNFSPQCFKPSSSDKFWDILYVARAVYFKKVPEFFNVIRKLYDDHKRFRVLLICPVPPYDKNDRGVFHDIRNVYDKMFTEEEKDYFTLLTLDYRYPFPLDLETLAHFYRSSKIFVHTADDERRCRVVGYAWATGMPVVGMPCVGSLLPSAIRKEPFFYETENYADFPSGVIKALTASNECNDFTEVRKIVSEEYTKDKLLQALLKYTNGNKHIDLQKINFNGLDLRLGRHHGLASGKNRVPQSLPKLINYLNERPNDSIAQDLKVADPESNVAAINKYAGDTFKIWHKSYLKGLFNKFLRKMTITIRRTT